MKSLLPIRSIVCIVISISLFAACSRKPNDGFRPPLSKHPLQSHLENWRKITTVSGTYRVQFYDSESKRTSVEADIVIEPALRSFLNLRSSRGSEATVTITPEFLNLINHRQKYFLREVTNSFNSERMVGLFLPSQELAAVISGNGFISERNDSVLSTPTTEGGIEIKLFHSFEPITMNGYIDPFGRLRSLKYVNEKTDQAIMSVTYLSFASDKKTKAYWPKRVEINLIPSGERIIFEGSDVDLNSEFVARRLPFTFARREFGARLKLESIPPGEPILYRNLKPYVENKK